MKHVLAFDFGLRRIGVAVGQLITRTASPLQVLAARDGQPDWQQVSRLLETWQPTCLLVGNPLNMDGSESEMSRRASRFAGRLHGRFGLVVHKVDERLSSREHRRAAHPGQVIDDLAAVTICEDWLRTHVD